MIYMYTTKLQGLYQNNVNSRTISITVKWAKEDTLKWNCNSCYTRIWLLAIEPTQQSQIPFVVSELNESVYILTSFRLGICSSACPFKLISNTCRQSDSLHLSSWKLWKRMEKSDYYNALTIFTNTVTLGRCRFSPLSVLLKN